MPRKNRRKTNWTPEQQAAFRDHVWRHNSFVGQTNMAMRNMRSMASQDSVSTKAAGLCREIEKNLIALETELRNHRIDPPYIL